VIGSGGDQEAVLEVLNIVGVVEVQQPLQHRLLVLQHLRARVRVIVCTRPRAYMCAGMRAGMRACAFVRARVCKLWIRVYARTTDSHPCGCAGARK
jgi:hypothetical protein